MVPRRDRDVPDSGGLGGRDPRARVEFHGVEGGGQPFVRVDRNRTVLHHPFALAELAVHAPVDEHPELGIAEPLAGGDALGGNRRRALAEGGVSRQVSDHQAHGDTSEAHRERIRIPAGTAIPESVCRDFALDAKEIKYYLQETLSCRGDHDDRSPRDDSRAPPSSGVHGRRRAHAVAGHRKRGCSVQRRRRRLCSWSALPGRRPLTDHLRAERRRVAPRAVLPDVPRLAGASVDDARHDRRARVRARRRCSHSGEGRPGAADRRVRHTRLFRPDGHAPFLGAPLCRRRRDAGFSARGRDLVRLLHATLRRRSVRAWHDDQHRQRADEDHRCCPAWIRLSQLRRHGELASAGRVATDCRFSGDAHRVGQTRSSRRQPRAGALGRARRHGARDRGYEGASGASRRGISGRTGALDVGVSAESAR